MKIYAKILTSRLDPLLPSLIHPDQVGFVRSRQEPDGTRTFVDLLQLEKQGRRPPVLISLDVEKGFDRVHWGYLRAVLREFGLTGFVGQAIQALYSNPLAKVLVSDILSHSFSITNGTRQGCPLPTNFCISVEALCDGEKAK